MKIKLNVDLLGHKAGEVINIKEYNGVPSNSFWRKRIKDSIIDNCVEIVSEKSTIIPESKKEEIKPEPKKEKAKSKKNENSIAIEDKNKVKSDNLNKEE